MFRWVTALALYMQLPGKQKFTGNIRKEPFSHALTLKERFLIMVYNAYSAGASATLI
jgi:hypothetical protein